MAITVTPIWTVASRREGFAFSSRAAWAPGLPASASGRSRAFRDATSAISAIAKNPFTKISKKTIERFNVSIAIAVEVTPDQTRRGVTSVGQIEQRKKPWRSTAFSGARPMTISGGDELRSARIIFDDQIGLHRHRVGYVRRLRRADEPAPHAIVVDLHIIGDVAFARLRRLEDERHPFCLRRELDRIAVANRIGRNGHASP